MEKHKKLLQTHGIKAKTANLVLQTHTQISEFAYQYIDI